MRGRYLGQVGRHKPCVPVVFVRILVPVWDHFATTVAVGALGRHGATQGLALRGRWSEWPGRVHGKGRVSSEYFGPPEWECEAMGSVVWVQCATSAECNNLSIAESMFTDTLESRSQHGSTLNKICTLSYELCTVDDG